MLKQWLSKWLSHRPQAAAAAAPAIGVPNPGVRIIDGRIVPHYACQTDLVTHCNLACRDCDHLSPIARKGFASPETLYRDFSRLAKVYRPQRMQVLGGEPLLHPQIVEAMHALRASGISDRIMVVTNGVLLARMPDAFWESIDDLEISVYPGSEPDAAERACFKAKAAAFGVTLELYEFSEFRRVFSNRAARDEALVRRIYRSCKKVHVWGCHSVYDGYLYRCPQSAFVPKLLGLPEDQHRRDGLKLHDGPGLRDELFAFLTDPEPLQACRNCLATAGVLRPHVQVRPREWLEHQDGDWESLIDFDELARTEAEMAIQKPDHIKLLLERQERAPRVGAG